MKTQANDFINAQEINNKIAMDGTVLGPGITTGGLTKREYFAAMALQGILSNKSLAMYNGGQIVAVGEELIEEAAVIYADALIRELNKEEK
jgi:hypothetical protein